MFGTKLKIAAGVAVGAFLSGGLAYAAIPAANGTITACYTKHPGLLNPQGSLRVVDTASECRGHETPLTWNQQGQPGPAGPEGVAGPAGPQGEPGDGVAGFASVGPDGFVTPGGTKNVTPGGASVTHVGPGQYCFNADALPFDPQSAQVTTPAPFNDPALGDRIAHVFVRGKVPNFAYSPCGDAASFPVHVSIWDVSDNAYTDSFFDIAFLD